MKHPIGNTRNGIPVYIDLIRSKAAAGISEQPHLLGLIKEVVSATKVMKPRVSIDYDMGRTIGYSRIVETAEQDSVLYAKLIRDDVYTRFVKSGKSEPTQHLTVVLQRDEAGEYELVDTWIGNAHPPRPGSEEETPESKIYWEDHAYIFDRQPVQSNTVTKVCPY